VIRVGGARRGTVVFWFFVLLAGAVGAACGSSDPTWPSDPRAVEFHPDLGVDLSNMVASETGLFYQDLEEGSGPAAAHGDTVSVHFRGWLPDATLFAESEAEDPVEFVLGLGRVIPGWDEGVTGMRQSGTRLLVLPPELAYGVQGLPNLVPPNTVVVFQIDLVTLSGHMDPGAEVENLTDSRNPPYGAASN